MSDSAEYRSSEKPLAVEWPEPLRKFETYLPGNALKIVGNLLACEFGTVNLETGILTDLPGISGQDGRFGLLLGDNTLVHYCPGMSEQFSVEGFYAGTLDKAERKLLSSAKLNRHLALCIPHGDHAFVYAIDNSDETGWDVYSTNACEDKTTLLLRDCPMVGPRRFFQNAMAYSGCISDQGKSSLITKRSTGTEILPIAFKEHGNSYQWNDWLFVVSKDHSTVQVFEIGTSSSRSLGTWSSPNLKIVFPWLKTYEVFNATLFFGASNDGYPVILRFNSGVLEVYRLRVPTPVSGAFEQILVSPGTICIIGNDIGANFTANRVLVYETKTFLNQVEAAITHSSA